jgi:hypothetical protein
MTTIKHYCNESIFEEQLFTYPNLYRAMVQHFGTGSHFVEIGCWKGQSASFMAVEIHNSRKKIKFDCVDHWSDGEGCPNPTWMPTGKTLFDVFLSNTERVNHIISPVRMRSTDAAKKYWENSLDFVFIDGDHSYKECKADILAWLPKMKNGSILAGHDYGWCTPVREAVHSALGEGVEKFEDGYGVGYKSYSDPWGEGCWMVQINRSENASTVK